MVHSNGTRWESQRFRMDFTGRTKYSGRSADFLFVSAGGEVAARRAMPTSRALAHSLRFAAEFRTGLRAGFCLASSAGDAGGQSAVLQSEMLPRWPATGARLPATRFGLRSSGHSGKSVSGVDRKSTRLNSSHMSISYAVFCLKKKKQFNVEFVTKYTFTFLCLPMPQTA